MARYENASTEPLEFIEATECQCQGYPGFVTQRFRAAFNEIHRLRELRTEAVKEGYEQITQLSMERDKLRGVLWGAKELTERSVPLGVRLRDPLYQSIISALK